MIEDWFRGILTDGILSNLSGLFDSVNTEVGEIATQVGTTPAGWNAGIFNMIRSLSENVIVPIAGVIITFVMCYELIQLVIEKNNLHDLDTWIFFKWIFKTFVAVLLVTNTWNIVMGVFDITQSVVNDSAGVIISDTSIDIATVITDIEAKLDAMSVGGLLGLWFQSLFVGLTMKAFRINRSCHTALKYVQKYFTGTKWFVEGDIKGCFDNVDHHVLIAILRKRIADEHFIGLLWKFLKAGYMEDWNYHNTYSGTPQGSIISPILANIYMNELDSYMAEYAEKFNCGNRRKINPAFKKKRSLTAM